MVIYIHQLFFPETILPPISSKNCCPSTPSTSIFPVINPGFTVIIKDFGISMEVKVSPMIIELEQSYKLPTEKIHPHLNHRAVSGCVT